MKRFIGKILTLILTFSLLLGSNANIKVFASTNVTPENTLTQYLTALEGQNINAALNYYTDSRAANDTQKLSILTQDLNDPNQRITNFSIGSRYSSTNTSVVLLANVTYANGEVDQVPFKLDYVNNSWIIRIGSQFAVESQYKIVKNSTKTIQSSAASTQMSTLSVSKKTTWNFTLSSVDPWGPDTQYTSTFNVSSSNKVEVNFRQWQNALTAQIQYAIVRTGFFGDTVYASQTVTLNNEGYASQVYLSVTSQSGVCLRVSHINYTYPAYSWGEVYN